MNVSAYNAHSPEAKHILAITDANDVLSQQMICTARVDVETACFYDEYQGPGLLRRPAMKMTGTVSSVFIEDDDNRYFPCGSKEIQLMTPERVEINYVLSTTELQELVGMGLYNEGFEPPANLIGNTFEIPLNIVYKGIYESPCCFVDIVDSKRLNTCTKDNRYDGLFMACRVHPGVVAERDANYRYVNMNILPERALNPNPAPAPITTPVVNEPVSQTNEPVLSAEEREDVDILSRTAAKIDEDVIAHTEQKSNNSKAFNAGPLVDEVQRAVKEDADNNSTQGSDLFTDNTDADAVDDGPHITTLSDKMEKLKEKARDYVGDDSGSDSGNADLSDVAQVDSELTDDDTFVDFDDDGLSDGSDSSKSSAKRRAEAAARKQREIARRLDVAEDNKALNEGNTDIAGHGANNNNGTARGGLAQRLLAGVKTNRQDNQDGRGFL